MSLLTSYTIFSQKARNTGRQLEVDWVKAIALIGMVFVHTSLYFSYGTLYTNTDGFSLDTVITYILSFIASGAILFMICLGIGIVYSKRSTPAYLAKRGLLIIAIGFILNICYMAAKLPAYYALITEMPTSALYISGMLLPGNILAVIGNGLFHNSILIFAGLTFLFFALVKLLKIHNLGVLIIGVVLFGVSQIIPENLFAYFSIPYSVLGSLIPLDDYKFSFINWIIYPIIGYLFGQVLLLTKSKAKLYRNVFLVSVGLGIFALVSAMATNIDIGEELLTIQYFMETPLSVVTELAFAGIMISLLYLLSTIFEKTKLTAVVTDLSRKLLPIYCIHNVLIVWAFCIATILFGRINLPGGWTVLLAVGFFLVSYFLSPPFLKVINRLLNGNRHSQSS